jgi:hypothetical protein
MAITKDQALAILRAASEQDFGENVEEWNNWLRSNRWVYTSRKSHENLRKNLPAGLLNPVKRIDSQ